MQVTGTNVFAALALASASLLVAPAARAGGCNADSDCPGEQICTDHVCTAPGAASSGAAPSTAPASGGAPESSSPSSSASTGGPAECRTNDDCGGDAICVAQECRELPSISHGRNFFFGAWYAVAPGLSGNTSNPVPGHSVGIEIANGEAIRYHFVLAYESLNGYQGAVMSPFAFGYAIPIRVNGWRLEVEPIVSATDFEALTNDGHALSLLAGARVQVVASYGKGYLALTPLGVDYRYFTLLGDSTKTNVVPDDGWNWHLGLGAGFRL